MVSLHLAVKLTVRFHLQIMHRINYVSIKYSLNKATPSFKSITLENTPNSSCGSVLSRSRNVWAQKIPFQWRVSTEINGASLIGYYSILNFAALITTNRYTHLCWVLHQRISLERWKVLSLRRGELSYVGSGNYLLLPTNTSLFSHIFRIIKLLHAHLLVTSFCTLYNVLRISCLLTRQWEL